MSRSFTGDTASQIFIIDGKQVRITVDFAMLCRTLGRKALRSKHGDAGALYGAVRASVEKVSALTREYQRP